MISIRLKWAEGADCDLPLPCYQTAGAAGADIRANLPEGHLTLAPGTRALVPTGLHMEIPPGYEVQVRPRSGLALKHGIALVNSPGTIDSDYRGPVGVIMINTGDTAFDVTHGMRIAQLVVAPVIRSTFDTTDTLEDTDRGAAGFGSTGSS